MNQTCRYLLIDEESDKSEEDRIFYMDPGFSVPDKADLLELDTENERSPIPERDTEEADSNPEYVEETKKQLQSDLIDKFIISNPRIEPARDKTDKPIEDISKPFVEERDRIYYGNACKNLYNTGILFQGDRYL